MTLRMAIKLPGFNWKVPEGHRTKQKRSEKKRGLRWKRTVREGAEI